MNSLANEGHQRGLRDFLTLYNTITEYCFDKCVSNFNERYVEGNETSCIDACTGSYVKYNQRLMYNFVDHQERRKKENERLMAEQMAAQAQLSPEEAAQASLQNQAMMQALEGLSATSQPPTAAATPVAEASAASTLQPSSGLPDQDTSFESPKTDSLSNSTQSSGPS